MRHNNSKEYQQVSIRHPFIHININIIMSQVEQQKNVVVSILFLSQEKIKSVSVLRSFPFSVLNWLSNQRFPNF